MKNKFWGVVKGILLMILLFICISLIIRFYILNTSYLINNSIGDRDKLKIYGSTTLTNFISPNDLYNIKVLINENDIIKVKRYIIESAIFKEKIQKILGTDYVFHDYIFLLKKSQFHSCHRDYNGDFFNKNQKHPSYTMIIYLEEMEKCLDVIHKSHENRSKNEINITDYTRSLSCNPGDAILFNANLIHSGSLNKKENHMRIQLKISHKDDIDTLYFYNKYNKVLNEKNTKPLMMKRIEKYVLCQLPIVSSYMKEYDRNHNKKSNKSSIFSIFYSELEDVPDYYP